MTPIGIEHNPPDVLQQMNEVINRRGYIVVAVECSTLPNGYLFENIFDSATDRKWDTKGHRFSIIGRTDVADWNAQCEILESMLPGSVGEPPPGLTCYRAITD